MVQNIQSTDKICVDLEMHQIENNEQKIASLRQEISNKYGVPLKNIEINFIPITVNDDGDRMSLASDIIDNIQDPTFEKKLMREYLTLKDIKDVDFNDIDTIDNQVNAFIDFDQYSKYKNYRFKYVKWSNYLSYGSDNFFDFTKLNGLVLLNSTPGNQSGKTTFAIDLLRFALFGKADKSPNLNSVFNAYLPEVTEVVVEACIEIDHEDYVIRRTVTRPQLKKRTAKSKCTQNVEYFKKIRDCLENIENCEGENNAQTNNIIKESVGNIDDFNLIISATASNLIDLIKMGQTDKGRLFSRWLGLLSIEKKEEVAKKLWKENYADKLKSSVYNKETLSNEIEDFKVVNTDNERQIKGCEDLKNEANERLVKLNEEKTNVLTSIKPVKDGLDKVDINTLDRTIEKLEEDLSAKRTLFSTLKEDYIAIKDVEYDSDAHNSKIAEKEKLENDKKNLEIKNGEMRYRFSSLSKEIESINELIQKGKCPTCKHDIDVSEQNGFIDEKKKEQNAIITEGKSNNEKIGELSKQIEQCKLDIKNHESNKETVNKREKLKIQLEACKANIDKFKSDIEANKKIKEDIKTNEENIKYNNELKNKTNLIDANIKKETEIKENNIREIERYKNEINKNNEQIKHREELIKMLLEEEKLIRNWNIYKELVGKNGITKMVLKEALPIINKEVDRLLNGLCDFQVKLDINESNDVVMELWNDGVKLDLTYCTSGFEGTMAALALRTALSNICTLSKPSFMVFDECLGTIASENYDNVHKLLDRILTGYDFILQITHNELIFDWHTSHIRVIKDNHISKIEYIPTMS